MSNIRYSDLEVVQPDRNAKYLATASHEFDNTQKESVKYDAPKYSLLGQTNEQTPTAIQPRAKRICGLPLKVFWIVAAVVAVIIIAAAVGGGVGGSLSSKSTKDISAASTSGTTTSSSMPLSTSSSMSSTQSASITTAPSSTAQQVRISTSTTSNAQYTLLVDCPSSNWTVYTPAGTTQMFRKICAGATLNQNGIDAMVNTPVTNLDDCIGLCAAYNVQYAKDISTLSKNVCNSVCFRDTITGNDWPGQCFGYTSTNSSGNFILGDGDGKCAGAALINQ